MTVYLIVMTTSLLMTNGHFHTRGQTNRLNGQIVWHLSIWCEFMLYCHRLVCLDRQIVLEKFIFPDGQKSDNLFVEKFVHPVCRSDDLSLQMICSSSNVKRANIFKRYTCTCVHVNETIIFFYDLLAWTPFPQQPGTLTSSQKFWKFTYLMLKVISLLNF